MSFLSGIFKKKVGGTFVGNLIRGVANKFSGGLLGNGLAMKQGPSVADQVSEALAAKEQAAAAAQTAVPDPVNDQPSALALTLNKLLKDSTEGVTVQGGIDPNTKWYIGGIAAAILLVVLMKKK